MIVAALRALRFGFGSSAVAANIGTGTDLLCASVTTGDVASTLLIPMTKVTGLVEVFSDCVVPRPRPISLPRRAGLAVRQGIATCLQVRVKAAMLGGKESVGMLDSFVRVALNRKLAHERSLNE